MAAERLYPGTTFYLYNAVRVNGVLTDADDITFQWKMGLYGRPQSVTPEKTATGTYRVPVTPLVGGNLYYRWDTEGTLDTAAEGVLSIADTQFEVTA